MYFVVLYMSWLDSYYQVYFSLMKDKFIIDITNDLGGAPGLPGGAQARPP